MSLSEKAAEAVAGLVGPGTPKSVHSFRATTIGFYAHFFAHCILKIDCKYDFRWRRAAIIELRQQGSVDRKCRLKLRLHGY